MNKIKNAIRTIPDFPIDGIMFRDVTTLYSNSEAMKEVIRLTCNYWKNKGLTIIAGIEARGFITGKVPTNNLSCNSVDIESSLFGINSNNLVNPNEPTVAKLKTLPETSFFEKPEIIKSKIVYEDNSQRPFIVK